MPMTEPVNWSDSPTGRERRQAGQVAGRAGPFQVNRARPRQRADLHGGAVGHVQAGTRVDLEQAVGEVHRGAERDRAAGDLERLEAEAELGIGDGLGIDDELAAAPLGDSALEGELDTRSGWSRCRGSSVLFCWV